MQTAANAFQATLGTVPTEVHAEYKQAPGGDKMRALAWFGKGDVRMVDAPVPDITEPDDVIVQVTGTTICGSDLHLYLGEIPTMQAGDILGHEFMGTVYKFGPNVKTLPIGQRVVASFHTACGQCEYCKKKLSSFCDRTNGSSLMNYLYGQRDAGIFGYSHLTGGFPGGQAEYVRVPFGNVNLLPLPNDVSDERALYLSDVLPTSYHVVVESGLKKGDVVAVWGLGPIGQCAARWAQLKGASRVIGIDKIPSRLAFAREKSGIEIIDINEYKDVPKRIYELVSRGLDVALDCGSFHEPKTLLHKAQKALLLETDVPETINGMIVSVKKRGTCALIGDYIGYANGVNVGALMEKGVRLIGCGQSPVHLYWQEILDDYIKTKKFDPTFMITHRVPLEDMPKLYAAFNKRQNNVEKVFVETKYSAPADLEGIGCPKLSRVDDWEA